MRQFRKATIKEVAARSGVSTTTVSNFVSGNVAVCSPETAERIREAISALQYVPSSLTRGLRQRTARTIGVCLPNPLDPDVSFGFSFLERLWRGIVLAADLADYALLHYPVSVRESSSSDAFLDGRVDGVLLSGQDNAREEQLAAAGMPTVLITRSLNLSEGCGAVWANETDTLDLALYHLWDLGHRRIACIAGPVGSLAGDGHTGLRPAADIAVRRLDAYIQWMRRRGVYDPSLVAFAHSWSAPQAGEYLDRWRALLQPPTAVVCANDAQALDLMAAAQSRGIDIPGDLSIIGVDNSPEARRAQPGLASVEVPLEAIGSEAVRTLMRLFEGAPVEQCRVAIPVKEIRLRESVARLGAE
ncbi:MAG: LacI family transcriptional regulator [Chthonomonadales bacterium]|nr:LacI family transcriptional regulator [Chthonomonadales bacterium]